jgi:hypothetical protein
MGLIFCYMYRKFGTYQFAKTTGYAVTVLNHPGRMISLCIEFIRYFQDSLGTELNAELAAFAAVFDQVDRTSGTFMLCGI